MRCGLGAEVPSWICGDCTDPCPEGIFFPTPASPRSGTRLEWLFSSGDHQQSSRAQGARGRPDPLWPMLTIGLGEKKGSVALLSKSAFPLRFIARGESMYPEHSSQNLVLSHGWDGASVLRSLAGSGVLLGPAARRHFPASSCFSTKGNTFGVDFQLRRPPAKQQGPGSQRQPRPSLAYGDQRARGEKGKRCFAEQWHIGAVVCSPRSVYLSRKQLPA